MSMVIDQGIGRDTKVGSRKISLVGREMFPDVYNFLLCMMFGA